MNLSEGLKSKSGAYVDTFGSLQITQKSCIMNLDSTFGLSQLKNKIVTTGSGSVSSMNGYIKLEVSGGSDSAILCSRERGVYQAGFIAEVGCGLIMKDADFLGDQVAYFGYYDDNDGFFFQYDTSGLSVCVRKGGITTNIPRSQWNGDYHTSLPVVDVDTGIIYRILFSFYGLGSITFMCIYTNADGTGSQTSRVLHTYVPNGSLSCDNPHLPIQMELYSNGSDGLVDIVVGGRQCSLLGTYDPPFRWSSNTLTVLSSETPQYIVSYKNRSYCWLSISEMDIITADIVKISFYSNCTLNDTNFLELSEESRIDIDTQATSYSGGILVYTCCADKSRYINRLRIRLIESMPVTMVVSGGACTIVQRFKEYF